MKTLKKILLFCQYMVVTEEIVKCWMCSDRPITHCLITGTLPKGYSQHPLCE